MSLETAQYVHQLNPANPSGADRLKEGDDHIRMLKAVLKATFPGITGPLASSVTHTFLNGLAPQLVPLGVITLWHGTAETVPAGWAICNGATVPKSDGSGNVVTPDLRDRVPVGVSTAHALGTTFGQTNRTVTTETAGAHKHTAIASSAGAHKHGLSGTVTAANTGITATLNTRSQDNDPGGGATNVDGVTINDPGHSHTLSGETVENGAHTHTIETGDVPAHAHSVTVDVTQPSIALYFIIKV